jgi:hypothetical protein
MSARRWFSTTPVSPALRRKTPGFAAKFERFLLLLVVGFHKGIAGKGIRLNGAITDEGKGLRARRLGLTQDD